VGLVEPSGCTDRLMQKPLNSFSWTPCRAGTRGEGNAVDERFSATCHCFLHSENTVFLGPKYMARLISLPFLLRLPWLYEGLAAKRPQIVFEHKEVSYELR